MAGFFKKLLGNNDPEEEKKLPAGPTQYHSGHQTPNQTPFYPPQHIPVQATKKPLPPPPPVKDAKYINQDDTEVPMRNKRETMNFNHPPLREYQAMRQRPLTTIDTLSTKNFGAPDPIPFHAPSPPSNPPPLSKPNLKALASPLSSKVSSPQSRSDMSSASPPSSDSTLSSPVQLNIVPKAVSLSQQVQARKKGQKSNARAKSMPDILEDSLVEPEPVFTFKPPVSEDMVQLDSSLVDMMSGWDQVHDSKDYRNSFFLPFQDSTKSSGPLASHKGKRLTKIIGEDVKLPQKQKKPGVRNSVIINGGALKKNDSPKSKDRRVQFSGLDQVILPEDAKTASFSPLSDTEKTASGRSSRLSAIPAAVPLESNENKENQDRSMADGRRRKNRESAIVSSDSLDNSSNELARFAERLMNSSEDRADEPQPTVTFPTSESENGQLAQKITVTQNTVKMLESTERTVAVMTPAKVLPQAPVVVRSSDPAVEMKEAQIVMNSEKSLIPVPQENQQVMPVTPEKRKVKRRHVQIQVRPVQVKHMTVQSDDIVFPEPKVVVDMVLQTDPTPDFQEEMEKLRAENAALKDEVKNLNDQISENKERFEILSEQAYTKLRQLVEERMQLVREINDLRETKESE